MTIFIITDFQLYLLQLIFLMEFIISYTELTLDYLPSQKLLIFFIIAIQKTQPGTSEF